MLPIMECSNCKFDLKETVDEETLQSIYGCDKFRVIPVYVEEATKPCPEFGEEK